MAVTIYRFNCLLFPIYWMFVLFLYNSSNKAYKHTCAAHCATNYLPFRIFFWMSVCVCAARLIEPDKWQIIFKSQKKALLWEIEKRSLLPIPWIRKKVIRMNSRRHRKEKYLIVIWWRSKMKSRGWPHRLVLCHWANFIKLLPSKIYSIQTCSRSVLQQLV